MDFQRRRLLWLAACAAGLPLTGVARAPGFQISSHGRSPSIKRTQRLSHGQAPLLPLVWWI